MRDGMYQLFSWWGTVLFYDIASCRLRHTALASAPANLALEIAGRQCRLVYLDPGCSSLSQIDLADPEGFASLRDIDEGDFRLEFRVADAKTLCIADEDYFLSAAADGFCRLTRKGCLDLEQFRPVEIPFGIKAPSPFPSRTEKKEVGTVCPMNSFDVFDTLIARRFSTVRPILEQIAQEYGLDWFVQARIGADNGARGLAEIYDAIGVDRAVMEREIELEHEHAVPIQENLDRVRDGDLLITDMYLPGYEILSMVRSAGLSKQVTLYGSNAGKSSGALWQKVAADPPALHLGDNAHSDFDVPRRFGITCELCAQSTLTEAERDLQERGLPNLAFLVREVRLRGGNGKYPEHRSIACQINLPWVFFFAELVRRKNKRPKVFLGRDCQQLHYLYGSYFERGYYVPFSRRVALHQPEKALQFLLSQSPEAAQFVDLCSTGATWERLQAPIEIVVGLYVDQYYYTKTKPILPEGFSYFAKSSESGHAGVVIELLNCGDHGYAKSLDTRIDGIPRLVFHDRLDLDPDLIEVIQAPVRCASSLVKHYRSRIALELSSKTLAEIEGFFKEFVAKISHHQYLQTPTNVNTERSYMDELSQVL